MEDSNDQTVDQTAHSDAALQPTKQKRPFNDMDAFMDAWEAARQMKPPLFTGCLTGVLERLRDISNRLVMASTEYRTMRLFQNNMLLCGPKGVGKTHLLTGWCRVVRKLPSVIVVEVDYSKVVRMPPTPDLLQRCKTAVADALAPSDGQSDHTATSAAVESRAKELEQLLQAVDLSASFEELDECLFKAKKTLLIVGDEAQMLYYPSQDNGDEYRWCLSEVCRWSEVAEAQHSYGVFCGSSPELPAMMFRSLLGGSARWSSYTDLNNTKYKQVYIDPVPPDRLQQLLQTRFPVLDKLLNEAGGDEASNSHHQLFLHTGGIGRFLTDAEEWVHCNDGTTIDALYDHLKAERRAVLEVSMSQWSPLLQAMMMEMAALYRATKGETNTALETEWMKLFGLKSSIDIYETRGSPFVKVDAERAGCRVRLACPIDALLYAERTDSDEHRNSLRAAAFYLAVQLNLGSQSLGHGAEPYFLHLFNHGVDIPLAMEACGRKDEVDGGYWDEDMTASFDPATTLKVSFSSGDVEICGPIGITPLKGMNLDKQLQLLWSDQSPTESERVFAMTNTTDFGCDALALRWEPSGDDDIRGQLHVFGLQIKTGKRESWLTLSEVWSKRVSMLTQSIRYRLMRSTAAIAACLALNMPQVRVVLGGGLVLVTKSLHDEVVARPFTMRCWTAMKGEQNEQGKTKGKEKGKKTAEKKAKEAVAMEKAAHVKEEVRDGVNCFTVRQKGDAWMPPVPAARLLLPLAEEQPGPGSEDGDDEGTGSGLPLGILSFQCKEHTTALRHVVKRLPEDLRWWWTL